MSAALPEPSRQRWQPLRAGLVDIFYYDTEEFWFRDGRLLLRGNNGTGKSKVLALTLPFLLDGDLSPHRVEPDADPKKRMEWNLLLGGAHPVGERLGYTWLEFGRLDEHDTPHYCTLGCGLKAVAGRGIARHWFFVTTQRPGADLRLIDATRTALTRDRLIDALGDAGRVYDTAREYRRAVDEQLFGFGDQRYGALVDLLVQLRQPQLSKRPSEKALSDALTEALPPLDQAVVADVAEAFRSLEEDRAGLTAMVEARDAAASFLDRYRRYAGILARRKAERPRLAQSAYERVNRDLAAAQVALRDAERQLGEARDRRDSLGREATRLQARDQTLRRSPEMDSARDLDEARETATRTAAQSRQAAQDRDRAAGQVDQLRRRHREADEQVIVRAQRLTELRRQARDAAAAAFVGDEHRRDVDDRFDAEQPPQPTALRQQAQGIAARQERSIAHLRSLLSAAAEAQRSLADARRALADLDTQADQLADRRTDADDELTARRRELLTAVEHHVDAATELRLPDIAATLAALELWTETLDGANPAAQAVAEAERVAADALTRADSDLHTEQQHARAELAEVVEQIAGLERGDHTEPRSPYTRDAAARIGRPGAPLWRLVDFRDHLDDRQRAGLEAALEAASILDAWVTPDGAALDAATADVAIRPGPPVANNLGTLLVPAVDRADADAAAVPDAAVARLLAAIAVAVPGATEPNDAGAGSRVGTDGRYRIGVLDGGWAKPAAEYIGRGAREAARRALLETLRADRDRLEARIADLTQQRTRLAERRQALSTEVETLPGDGPLRQAHVTVTTLADEAVRLRERHDAARERVSTALSAAEQAQAAVTEGGHDTGLPTEPAALATVESALSAYRVGTAELWPALDRLGDAQHAQRIAADDLGGAEQALTELAERAVAAETTADAAQERHETLSATVGAAVAELEAHLAELADQIRANQQASRATTRAIETAGERRGEARGELNRLEQELTAAAEERSAAAAAFQQYVETGLLAVALPELSLPPLPWAPDPTVRLARRVDDELSRVEHDDRSWDRSQRDVNVELKTLADTMSRHGDRAFAELHADSILVRVEYRGRPTDVPELVAALRAEISDRERLLNEREREVLENHLINEVASTLQELISAAEARVAAMNDELSARPTSTGMKLRLQWNPRRDGPAGLAEARKRLLRQTSDAWSDGDRSAVGGFLQEQIETVRSRDTTGTWLDHLTEALDYRRWHGFVIERHQNGHWRPATGPASGGERVLAASVPLFAAASSHYASAGRPYAPRLVTLDEAFAGVDDNARAKYLGLLAAFDLDVVMTSEREWGCYPEVPGLAIAQLSRTEDVAAVLVTRWEWDGRQRARVELPAEQPAEVQPAPDGLWS